MLTPYLPYPLWSGGQIRTYNLLKNLSRKHQITLFSFIRDPREKEYINNLKIFCKDVKVFLKRPPWSAKSLTLAAMTYYPLVVCMYLLQKVRNMIAEAIAKENFDLIHAETFYVMPNIPQNNIPIILIEQTIEYQVYRHFTHNVRFLPMKLLMSWDVTKILFWEKRFWRKASRVVAMSEADKTQMQKLSPGLKVDLVPNGVDTEFFSFKKTQKPTHKKTILFVGNFKWLQNREAVSILVKTIWPEIKKSLPEARLFIVGKFPTKEILDYASRSITVSSNVNDIRRVYEESDILLAPIYGPGGTRYKILESMASGLPVVTTATGIEGLDCVNGRHAQIAEDPSDLAKQTIKVLTNISLYNRLVRNGRKLVEEQYNWKKIAASLDRIYQKAATVK